MFKINDRLKVSRLTNDGTYDTTIVSFAMMGVWRCLILKRDAGFSYNSGFGLGRIGWKSVDENTIEPCVSVTSWHNSISELILHHTKSVSPRIFTPRTVTP